MERKKKTLFVLALLTLIGLTSVYISNTYARYATELTDKQGTVEIAKWAFNDENKDSDLEINLGTTYNSATLAGNKIAPGTEGSFDVKLVNTTTETGVDFTVTVKSLSNVPSNLKFYTDASFENEFQLNEGSKITGQLAALDDEGVNVPIYWKWDFGTSSDPTNTINVTDTTAGKNANDLTITLSITGVQTQPSTDTTEFNSKVNSWTN